MCHAADTDPEPERDDLRSALVRVLQAAHAGELAAAYAYRGHWRSIGRFFGLLCFVSFRFALMYAAGRLEAMNVGQYADARRCAKGLGLDHFVAELQAMCDEELRHEIFFGDQCRGHVLLPMTARICGWTPPPPSADDARPDSGAVEV